MKLSILSVLILTTNVLASDKSTQTLDGRSGLFHLLSADILEKDSYHFKTSIEYFQQDGLVKDSDDSRVRDTKATLAFGYALTPHIHLTADSGFSIASRTPQAASAGSSSGTETIDLFRAGLAATGIYDASDWFQLPTNRFTLGLSLWIDFAKITRFIESPNIIPTAIFTGDFTDSEVVPVRTHLNLGFRLANSKRFYANSSGVTDYGRFVTDTLNSWAWTSGVGVEFPFSKITPSVEMHMVKSADTSFSNAPKWVTAGLKGNPFPTSNIELFGGVDVGLSSFKATASGQNPDSPVVPLWNAILGFSVSQFGLKEGETNIGQVEYNRLKSTVAEQAAVLQGLKQDLEFNIVQGRVVDAATKLPLSGVSLSFPENPELKGSKTDSEGRFVRYFKSISAARLVVSADGYDASSKFLALKPGERVTVDIELRKASVGEQLADYVATVTNENGAGLVAEVRLTNIQTGQTILGNTDRGGQISLKVLEGSYRLDLKAEGMQPVTEVIEFQKGKTVLRSYSLTNTK